MRRILQLNAIHSAFPVILTLTTCLILGTSACSNNQKSKTETEEKEEMSQKDTDSLSAQASGNIETAKKPFEVKTVKSKKRTKTYECDVEIDYPVSGEEALLDGARRMILEHFGIKGKADGNNPQGIANKVLAASIRNLDIPEDDIDGSDDGLSMIYMESNSVKMKYLTDKFVTFGLSGYTYTGGAHGMSSQVYKTIDARTGKVMEWNDIFAPSVRTKLKALVRKAIVKQYYDGDDASLDVLMPFDLPANAPSFTPKGIHFIYSLYEIDCYAAGMPECEIPYSVLKPLMTESAGTLIP